MSVFYINLPKPPEDVWAIEVDFTDRLDTDGGEELTSAAVEAYRLWGYDYTLYEASLQDAVRLDVVTEKTGNQNERVSFLLKGEPSFQLRLPKDYDAEMDLSIVDASSVTIGPASGTPPNTKVSFHIQNGVDGNRYALLVTATTNQGRQHSCVIRFTVQEINPTA